jgi:hypothetical protein
MRLQLEPEQKALEINLDESIYGSFAEIGAGQEVARHFFQVGGAAGTIAKTMSAYDKTVSDRIYGPEEKGRYVCESRVYKMLDHEYDLMVSRLREERPGTRFFAFADTISAINYHKTNKGDGWMGIRFQCEPGGDANDIVMHIKMLDNDNTLQQQAVGILGVNLIYACSRYRTKIDQLISSLLDNLHGRMQIDMLRIQGPDFRHVDNRLVALALIRHNMTDVSMFDSKGNPVHASEYLYKNPTLVVRGSWRPPTLVNLDMQAAAMQQFIDLPSIDTSRIKVLSEITLSNLQLFGDVDEKDFLDRVDVLGRLGHTVILSNCDEYAKLVAYLSDYKIPHLGLVIGVRNLMEIIRRKYENFTDGRLLASIGDIFVSNARLYVYPSQQPGSDVLLTCQNVAIPEGVKYLYKHLLENQQIIDITGFRKDILNIYSTQVLDLLRSDAEGWDKFVPEEVAKLIRENCLFGFPCQRMEFEY